MSRPESVVVPPQRCARCGAPFTCGLLAGAARCWCADLPPIAAPLPGLAGEHSGCLCPACLQAAVARAQGAGHGA